MNKCFGERVLCLPSRRKLLENVGRIAGFAAVIVLVLAIGFETVGQACSSQSYLAGPTARAVILQTIEAASRSLDISLSSFVDLEFGDAVLRAVQRGLSVRVILEVTARAEVGSQYARLIAAQAAVRLAPASALTDHRFVVVDGVIVLVGSYGWSSASAQGNAGSTAVIRCPPSTAVRSVADDYAVAFDRLWELSQPVQTKKVVSGTASPMGSVRILEVDCDSQCVSLFNSSTEAIDLSGCVITDFEGRYVFPEGTTLQAGELFRLCIGSLNPADIFLLYFDPEQDEAALLASDGLVIDQMEW